MKLQRRQTSATRYEIREYLFLPYLFLMVD
jgi:hypothetical protein